MLLVGTGRDERVWSGGWWRVSPTQDANGGEGREGVWREGLPAFHVTLAGSQVLKVDHVASSTTPRSPSFHFTALAHPSPSSFLPTTSHLHCRPPTRHFLPPPVPSVTLFSRASSPHIPPNQFASPARPSLRDRNVYVETTLSDESRSDSTEQIWFP